MITTKKKNMRPVFPLEAADPDPPLAPPSTAWLAMTDGVFEPLEAEAIPETLAAGSTPEAASPPASVPETKAVVAEA